MDRGRVKAIGDKREIRIDARIGSRELGPKARDVEFSSTVSFHSGNQLVVFPQ